MRYRHHKGDRAPTSIKVSGVGSVPIADGEFECDPEEEVHELLVSRGHEPVTEDADDADDADQEGDGDVGDGDEDEDADADGQDEREDVRASDYSEDELVAMDRNTLRPIASRYDDIDGNASADKLTEELIAQRRSELEEG